MSDAEAAKSQRNIECQPLGPRARTVLRGMRCFAAQHRDAFAKGAASALVLVALRLALPWPLRVIADQWVESGAHAGQSLASAATIATGSNLVLPMGLAFLVMLILLGLFDLLSRLHFARFAIGTVRDLRTAAIQAAVGDGEVKISAKHRGDFVARLIGDTARIKTGLQGFLVHVVTNGVLYVGVTLVLFSVDVRLGSIFALAGIATAIVIVRASAVTFRNALRHRRKEGQLANQIQKALRSKLRTDKLVKLGASSGRAEALQTRTQGQATLSAHVIFGLAVFATLLVGAHGVDAGRIPAGDLVMFMMYAVMLRAPVVQLARQGARTGKILGAAHRVVQVLQGAAVPQTDAGISAAERPQPPARVDDCPADGRTVPCTAELERNGGRMI